MKLENWNDASNYFKQFELPDTLTHKDIRNALPGIDERPPSKDRKVGASFRFIADGNRCAIWRWKGGSWSAFGPRSAFVSLGLLPN